MADDYYNTLGVSKQASPEEIKKAYKTLAKKYHPDMNKEAGAEETFKKISEAYAVLSDPHKKQTYDTYGPEGFHKQYSTEDIFRGFDFGDLGGDIFDMFFGGGRRQKRGGRDVHADVTISFMDAMKGVSRSLTYERMVLCSSCSGTGSKDGTLTNCSVCHGHGQVKKQQRTPFGVFVQVGSCDACGGQGKAIAHPCVSCHGEGRKREKETVTVKIPAGIQAGMQLRVMEKGEAGKHSSRSGDLYVAITVEPSDIFTRQDNDLYLEVPLSFSQVVLGDEISVPTLEKDVTLKIPSGTQTGTKFRLKGYGVPYVDGYGSGDLYVIVHAHTPKKLSKEQRELFEKLRKNDEQKKSFLDRIKEFARMS